MQRHRIRCVPRLALSSRHAHAYKRSVWLDAPFVLTPVDLAETFSTPAELDAPEAAEETDPAMQPRGWWKVDAKRTRTDGIEQSFELIRDVLKKDHYDVSRGLFPFRA